MQGKKKKIYKIAEHKLTKANLQIHTEEGKKASCLACETITGKDKISVYNIVLHHFDEKRLPIAFGI